MDTRREQDCRCPFDVREIVYDVQKLLPQLSVFLGHSHLCSTQVYAVARPS